MEQSETRHKEEFVILLDLLARVISAGEPSSIGDIGERERLGDAHNLANKFIEHALTVLHLSRGTIVQDLPSFKQSSFTDSASIDVLTRATMEAFSVFHYVFFAPKTTEEKDYRYWVHKAAGLAERQNLPEAAYEHEQTKAEDKKELDKLREELKANAVFQGLNDKQKKRILRGEWKLKSWREIAIDAGFSKMLASHMYRHLSGYAHSSSLSVLQTAQALINKETEKLIQSSIDTMNVLIANMIREYCGLCSKAQDVLKESGAINFVETWIEIGRRLDENLDIGQDSD